MSTPVIFISYSHDSVKHAGKVRSFADMLIRDGLDCILDQYESDPAEGWPRWMTNNIKRADFVLMICTETYYKRVMGTEEPGTGLGVKWEGSLIYNEFYINDSLNTKFIPVLFDEANKRYIPDVLRGVTYYTPIKPENYTTLYRRLTRQPKAVKPSPGLLRHLPPEETSPFFECGESSKTSPDTIVPLASNPRIDISKLPVTGSLLYGREKELQLLDDAWNSTCPRIISFVAFGGVGKSALVNGWLNTIGDDDYRGAARVYAWSFYSQGTRENSQASADEFFTDAFKWFGHRGDIPRTQHEKGRLLAELVSAQKTLLILDGLEPLQYPPGPMHGHLKDKTMAGFLKNLARSLNGLCIITTRCTVEDLKATEGKASRTHELEHLSVEAGTAVLKSYGLKGRDQEFKDTTNEFGGHALALHLVGSYLKNVHKGDIRKRDLIPELVIDKKHGGHARRVMESYVTWFADTDNGEFDILNLMGLFDRPASKDALDVLMQEPAIKGLTDRLHTLSNDDYQYTLNYLRDLHLIAGKDHRDDDSLDCHPLIREHFAARLRESNPAAWKAAHTRLYEYYKNLPEKKYPDTIEEMEPLFTAVTHGCQAGKYQEALIDVYWKRIRRSREDYAFHKLGAFGAALACISNFFETPWYTPAPGLTDGDKAVVLNWAGFALRATGRLAEAAEPMKAAVEAFNHQSSWKQAALDASNLSELYLTAGDVPAAVDSGARSVTFADRSGDENWTYASRTTHADALHQAGDGEAAERLFAEAEAMQKARQSEYPYLYSLRGFQFCDLLLSRGRYAEVLDRARTTIEWVKKENYILDIALDTLSIGKALMLQAGTDDTGALTEAGEYLNRAVAGLRDAGAQHRLPLGLLARAAFYRRQRDFDKAWADLDEVREIAEYGGMRLFLVDYHLEAARLIKAQSAEPGTECRVVDGGVVRDVDGGELAVLFERHVDEARRLIEETGYHRRDGELVALEGR